MNTWVGLWRSMLDSTLWEEDPDVRLTFIAMLLLKDTDHVVRVPQRVLAKKVNLCADKDLNYQRVEKALGVLLAPDAKSIENQEFEGRRVRVNEGGWLVLNGEKYDEEMRALWARVRKTEKQRKRRELARVAGGVRSAPSAVEQAVKKLETQGKSAEAARALEIERKRVELLHKQAVEGDGEIPGLAGEAPAEVARPVEAAAKLAAAGLKVKGAPGPAGVAPGVAPGVPAAGRSSNPFAP